MSEIKQDAKQVVADAAGAVKLVRRRLAARCLDWLRRHPRSLLAIVAAVTLIAVTFGLARG